MLVFLKRGRPSTLGASGIRVILLFARPVRRSHPSGIRLEGSVFLFSYFSPWFTTAMAMVPFCPSVFCLEDGYRCSLFFSTSA